MTTVPEEAVQAAAIALANYIGHGMTEKCVDKANVALTAALPHLPQGVGVKELEWRDHAHGSRCVSDQRYDISIWVEGGKLLYVDNYTTMRRHSTLEAAKAAAQADYEARILSALEPSTARELALDMGRINRFDSVDPSESIGCYGGSGQWIELGTVADIRALSSPDQADAGKVEGDGWLPMTHPDLPLNGASVVMFDSFISGKDGFGQVIARFDKTHGWHVSASVVGGKYIQLTNPIKWRPLFSAPSQEVAGS